MSEAVTIESLRGALTAGELVFYYQPKVSMVLGTVCGAEALIRWIKPDGTIVGPGMFIPLAESTGFITEITRQMLQSLVADLAIVHAVDASLTVSFNASARDFDDDRLVAAITRLLDLGIVPAAAIEVELTESSVHVAGPELAERLRVLRSRGVGIAMDDFGTGYSSIDSLSRLPFSALKIDQGIVGRMETSAKDASIVESSIRMGHRIGLSIVAEGIETESCFLRLQAAGCSSGQGYWMGRPAPLDQLIALLQGGKRWHSGALGLVHMAMIDHLEWRKVLIDAVVSGASGANPAALSRVQTEPAECRLGRWYDGPGRELADITAFRDLAEPHAALHACSKQIVDALRDGAQLSGLMAMMHLLTERSTRVIALLQALEQAVLMRMGESERSRAKRELTTGPPTA